MSEVKLYCGDCLEILPTLEAGSVDAVVTDPPYGVGVNYGDLFQDTKDHLEWLVNQFMIQVLAIGKLTLIFCGNGNQYLYPPPDHMLCWHIPAGNGYNSWGFTTWQPILGYGKPYRENGNAYPDAISMSPVSDINDHPCPKPTKLMRYLVERYTPRGTTILDPFMGSGTTGVACVQTGRNFIGIEIDPHYFEIATKRIKQAQMQLRMEI